MTRLRRLIIATAALLSATLTVTGGIQTVVYDNQALPGDPGHMADLLSYQASISRNGQVAIRINATPLSSSHSNDNVLLLWSDGQLTTLLYPGAPFGNTGTLLTSVGPPTLSPNGQYLTFSANTNPSTASYQQSFLWDRNTPQQFVPLLGPVVPAYSYATSPHLNDAGQFAMTLIDGNTNTLLVGAPGHVQTLLTPGVPLPNGTATNAPLVTLAINNAGQTLFSAPTDDNSPGSVGIYLTTPSQIRQVAARNQPAPGIPNAWFSDVNPPLNLSDAGRTAFLAGAVGPGLTTSNDQGIWTGSPDSLKLLAREGDPPPTDPAQRFTSFSDPNISAQGHVAFIAGLSPTPAGGTYAHDSLWITNPADQDHLSKVAAIGDPTPDLAGTFTSISAFALADNGVIAFFAGVKLDPVDDGIHSPDDDQYTWGIWLGRPGGLRLLLQENQPINVDGRPSVAVSASLATADYSDPPLRVTDDGRVLAFIFYRDADDSNFGQGLFLLSVPEPSLLAIAATLLVPPLSSRIRRNAPPLKS